MGAGWVAGAGLWRSGYIGETLSTIYTDRLSRAGLRLCGSMLVTETTPLSRQVWTLYGPHTSDPRQPVAPVLTEYHVPSAGPPAAADRPPAVS